MKSLLVSLLVISPALAADNPLFEKSPLPYQLPQFDKITDADFKPAFEEGMARQLKEVQAMVDDPSVPTQFSQQLLKAAKDSAVVFEDAKELDGMSSEQLGAASEAARMRKLDGKWLITLQNTTTQAVLENLKSRATREKIHSASIGR